MKPQELEAIRERANLQCGLSGDDADALLVEVTRLRGVVQGMLRLTEAQPVHAYAGLCPDVSQPNTFDPECPACVVIVEAAGMTSTEGGADDA